MTEYFIGLMSGTSLDGVDAVATAFDDDGRFTVLADQAVDFPPEVRDEVLALQSIGHDELRRSARLANRLADLYAEAVNGVLRTAGLMPEQVCAIGCHGQTIRHAPDDGYTLQIGNLARLAEQTGIDVAGDFRSRDVAAGGQGAPLVPAFHQAAFGHPARARVIVNIGGISNLTLLLPGEPVSGFDCGPGNMLLDAWCRRHLQRDYDADGAWAASGHVDAALLDALLEDPFFTAKPPKSTGRDLFDLDWLDRRLAGVPEPAPADVQATLLAQTVSGIADAIDRFAGQAEEVFLCGGGARNGELVRRLAARLRGRRLADSSELGLPPHQVEATAFAWLARQLCHRAPGNVPAATGAAGPRVLGALYPGRP
jgi:anhydro-N-acetylmuramic acid kinase